MFWDEGVETISRRELEKLQGERLRESVARAAQSPFYKKRFAEAGLAPERIKGLADLSRIPFTTKDDLRISYPYGMLAVPLREVVRMHASSGTTGTPTVIYHTAADIDGWAGLCARSIVAAGVGPDDVFQNMMSYGLFTGGLGLHYGAEKVGCLTIPAGPGNTARQIKFMQDFGTTAVHMTPSYALHVADCVREAGIDPAGLTLRVAFFGAEPYSAGTARKLEAMFGLTAINSYGLSEMNGPGVAFECSERTGMHLWEDHYIMEVVDPRTGGPAAEGEVGELVLTTLQRTAMPVLRYRTRDLTRVIPGEPCPCGRTHRRIDRIMGRTDDMLIIRGVNVFPSQVEHVLMGLPEVGNNYQIVLDRVGHLDRMTIRVELYGKLFHGELRELRDIQRKIEEALRAQLVLTPKVELVEPGTLPASMGKAVRVIDNRQAEDE